MEESLLLHEHRKGGQGGDGRREGYDSGLLDDNFEDLWGLGHSAVLEELPGGILNLPVRQRQAKDVWGLLLFIAFWVGMLAIGIVALKNGEPDRSNYGEDNFGNLCGYDNTRDDPHMRDHRSLPYLQILDDQSNGPRVCVAACPTKTAAANWLDKGSFVCTYDIVPPANQNDLLKLIKEAKCSPGVFASKSKLHRCVPTQQSDTFTNPLTNETEMVSKWTPEIADNVDQYGISQRIVASLATSWKPIMGFAVMSGVLSFVWILCLQHLAGCLLWTTIWGVVASGTAFSAYLFVCYTTGTKEVRYFPTDAAASNEAVLLAMAILSLSFTLGILVLVGWWRRQLILAVAIIKEAGKAVRDIPELLLVPVLANLLLLLLFAYWGHVCVDMASAGEVRYLDGYAAIFTPYKTLRGMVVYHVIGLLWTVQLVIGVGQCVVAYAVVSWYFAHDKEGASWRYRRLRIMVDGPATIVRYHLGSVAVGALLLAFFQWLHWLIQLVRRHGREHSVSVPWLGEWLAGCMLGAVRVIEAVMRLVNQNAYVEIAMYGEGFFISARRAIVVLARNCLSYTAVQYVSDLYLLLGRVVIGLLAAYATGRYVSGDEIVDYYSIPMLMGGTLGYFMASAFLSVYKTAIDTIFLCYCEDIAYNDGSPEKPFFMSEDLQMAVVAGLY